MINMMVVSLWHNTHFFVRMDRFFLLWIRLLFYAQFIQISVQME